MFITMKNNDLKQISELLDNRLDNKLAPIQRTLFEHSKILKSHGKMLKSLKKDQGIMLEMLDGEQMKQKRRLTKIEAHLGFTPAS